ncbi:sensor histidine kinase [Actinophytocola sp. S1-96]|uniref:histidine kinase n=2 Tax=Actinophytocola gossypii TaxID=2812003 RepID=A0ABT2J764_9PSEU|nr:sensor histidine kinase [Actinophytocola gossypii]
MSLLLGVVAVLVGATAYGEYAAGTVGWVLVMELVLGAVGIGVLPWLFRRPVRTALALAALAAVAPTATPVATIGTLTVSRVCRLPVAIGVAAAGTAAHAVRGLWLPMAGLSYGWWLVLVVVAHAALVAIGALSQTRAALIDSLRERAERAEAEQGRRVAEARAAERAAIAREMHDVLAHRLSLVATYAGAIEYRPDLPPEKLATAAGVVRGGVHQALDELRDVITLLNEDTSAADSPLPALDDLPELVEESRAIGTPVDVRDTRPEAELPGPTGRTAYRVLQEALTNARKHAPGQAVTVTLDGTPGGRLLIEVCNPLPPAPAPAVVPGAGSGLVGLTERVRLAGGRLDHRATAREFRLSAWLPWPA